MQKHKSRLKRKILFSIFVTLLLLMVISFADARISSKLFKSSARSKTAAPVSPQASPSKISPDKSTASTAAGAAVGAATGKTVGSAIAGSQAIKATTSQATPQVPTPVPLTNIAAAKEALLHPETFDYNPIGKSDPFRPFMETETKPISEAAKAKALPVSPLQRLDTEQFTLVGIAGNSKRRVAMLEDKKDKKFYPIIVGTAIGIHNGKVIDIASDRVIVEEQSPASTSYGERSKAKRIILKLRKEE